MRNKYTKGWFVETKSKDRFHLAKTTIPNTPTLLMLTKHLEDPEHDTQTRYNFVDQQAEAYPAISKKSTWDVADALRALSRNSCSSQSKTEAREAPEYSSTEMQTSASWSSQSSDSVPLTPTSDDDTSLSPTFGTQRTPTVADISLTDLEGHHPWLVDAVIRQHEEETPSSLSSNAETIPKLQDQPTVTSQTPPPAQNLPMILFTICIMTWLILAYSSPNVPQAQHPFEPQLPTAPSPITASERASLPFTSACKIRKHFWLGVFDGMMGMFLLLILLAFVDVCWNLNALLAVKPEFKANLGPRPNVERPSVRDFVFVALGGCLGVWLVRWWP